ncbi:EbsA family protein [Vagococcus elongatus]|uniref:Pore-forming protein n=1 Tax=Vagococcus elongatus TaxID=180344 RepID=A0A430B5T6_9ENTE|nr:EbsA family protein [Vagococcus elongatus]RSU15669.1 hypothetical protein CBF29_00930 [Vagococcus elongatus]
MEKQLVKYKKYHWQPEISRFVIYWSYTLGLLCFGIIIQLEKIKFNWLTIALICVSLAFILNGWMKYFILTERHLCQWCINPKIKRKVMIKNIESISVGSHGFTLTIKHFKGKIDRNIFLMRKKTMEKFLADVASHSEFKGQIIQMKEKQRRS